jgi:vacuolar-type H+-ATPase subunit H
MPEVGEVWTLAAYVAHNEALRGAEEKLQSERDRRYTEVKNAEEKALKIKEEADKTALGLQRDNQNYRDEKANDLREQISGERGLYVRNEDLSAAVGKIEATIEPLSSFVARAQGRSGGIQAYNQNLWVVVAVGAGLVGHFIH